MVATVLTACGIETSLRYYEDSLGIWSQVATVLTACGIETCRGLSTFSLFNESRLQQYLPLAVLKL